MELWDLYKQRFCFLGLKNKNKVVTIKESFETTFYEFINNQWVEEKYDFMRLETSIDYLINFDKVKEYFKKIRKKSKFAVKTLIMLDQG